MDFLGPIETILKERFLTQFIIMFSTEDPIAEEEFRLAAHPSWNVNMDHFYTEYLPFRMNRTQVYNAHSYITEDLNGKPGLWALGSFLGAMEANFFVLTTITNWSRLLNELRTNAMDSRCCGCTDMIDVQEENSELQVLLVSRSLV